MNLTYGILFNDFAKLISVQNEMVRPKRVRVAQANGPQMIAVDHTV